MYKRNILFYTSLYSQLQRQSLAEKTQATCKCKCISKRNQLYMYIQVCVSVYLKKGYLGLRGVEPSECILIYVLHTGVCTNGI